MNTEDFHGTYGFSQRWRDFPDYIVGITKEIWEDRGIGTLNHYYSEDIPVRTPMGITKGNKAVIASTEATIHEFPDRQLYGEDVIWSAHETGLLSSHRIITTASHSGDGTFGKASGKRFTIRALADCAARDNTIFDEWLVRDYGGLVRQLGKDPKKFARRLISREGGVENCVKPFTPANDIAGGYTGTGNKNEWGERYADTLHSIMAADFNVIHRRFDRAFIGNYPGAVSGLSHECAEKFWIGLRSAFPNAVFTIQHQIGMDADTLPPRAAIRWSLDGKHEGPGPFGRPTGADVHVMGISHAEFGPFVSHDQEGEATIRRETALYDEIAIWKQILMQTGE